MAAHEILETPMVFRTTRWLVVTSFTRTKARMKLTWEEIARVLGRHFTGFQGG